MLSMLFMLADAAPECGYLLGWIGVIGLLVMNGAIFGIIRNNPLSARASKIWIAIAVIAVLIIICTGS